MFSRLYETNGSSFVGCWSRRKIYQIKIPDYPARKRIQWVPTLRSLNINYDGRGKTDVKTVEGK